MSENKSVGRRLEEIPIGWPDRYRSFIAKVLDDHDQRIKWLEEQTQKPQAEPVYIGPRSFWDWLAERNLELPKRNAVLKFAIPVAFVLAIIGVVFFLAWFHHFGTDWAQVPVFVSGMILIYAAFMGFIFSMGKICS
jgi:fatty acid desaturase